MIHVVFFMVMVCEAKFFKNTKTRFTFTLLYVKILVYEINVRRDSFEFQTEKPDNRLFV